MKAALAVIALASFLVACAPQVAPSGSGVHEPSLTKTHFVTADGLSLPVRRWLPDHDPSGVVLAVHGFNDYAKSFGVVPNSQGVGPFLASQGYAVYAYDQRGFGAAPHAGLWPGEDTIANDFSDFAVVLDGLHPKVPPSGWVRTLCRRRNRLDVVLAAKQAITLICCGRTVATLCSSKIRV